MKQLYSPKELLNLPNPWRITDSYVRHEQLQTYRYASDKGQSALNVLERCLCVLSVLKPSDSIPEELVPFWDFEADFLAEKIPTFDDFEEVKVEQFLKEEGFESPSPNLVKDVAEFWFWWVTRDITKAILSWLHEALRGQKNLPQITSLIQLAECYWSRLPPRLTQYLFGRCATIGWEKALPLLTRVTLDPQAHKDVRKTARDYRQLILNHPEQWLKEDLVESSLTERNQMLTLTTAMATA